MNAPDRVSITGPFTLISEVVLLMGIAGLFVHEAWRLFAPDRKGSIPQPDHFDSSLLALLVLGAASTLLCVRLLRDRRVILVNSEIKIASLFSRRTVPVTQVRDVYWIERIESGMGTAEAAIVILKDGADEETIRFSPQSISAFETLRSSIPNLQIDRGPGSELRHDTRSVD